MEDPGEERGEEGKPDPDGREIKPPELRSESFAETQYPGSSAREIEVGREGEHGRERDPSGIREGLEIQDGHGERDEPPEGHREEEPPEPRRRHARGEKPRKLDK